MTLIKSPWNFNIWKPDRYSSFYKKNNYSSLLFLPVFKYASIRAETCEIDVILKETPKKTGTPKKTLAIKHYYPTINESVLFIT